MFKKLRNKFTKKDTPEVKDANLEIAERIQRVVLRHLKMLKLERYIQETPKSVPATYNSIPDAEIMNYCPEQIDVIREELYNDIRPISQGRREELMDGLEMLQHTYNAYSIVNTLSLSEFPEEETPKDPLVEELYSKAERRHHITEMYKSFVDTSCDQNDGWVPYNEVIYLFRMFA